MANKEKISEREYVTYVTHINSFILFLLAVAVNNYLPSYRYQTLVLMSYRTVVGYG